MSKDGKIVLVEIGGITLEIGNLNYELYKLDDGSSFDAVVRDETVWLTQKMMSELFEVGVPAINKHLKNIFEEEELDEKVVISKMEITTQHGALMDRTQTKVTNFYNLDAIISVGYRVNSLKATRFRQWATKILSEYMRKGFVMDDERLKQGERTFGKDYFKELLERVRSIRTSERRIWLQITDIFAEISVDYDKDSPQTNAFFAMMQNKFHYAITGSTAAELIYARVDSAKDNMGLTTWRNAPDGRIIKSDVEIAKNYLDEKELRRLERSISGYFDYIEDLLEDEQLLYMKDFDETVNAFLNFRRFKVLAHRGRISKEQAREKAHAEYDVFNKTQVINSDFEQLVLQLKE